MSEETTNPVDGEAMPEVVDEQDALENDVQDSFESNPDEEQEPDDTEGEEEEVDYEGKQYRVPKELKDALLRQADYTRKTQEVAETKRTLAQREEILAKIDRRQAEHLGDVSRLSVLNDRLSVFDQTDWIDFVDRYGREAAEARLKQYNALRAARDGVMSEIKHKVKQREAEEEREFATLVEQGRAELQKHIKVYGPETLSKLEAFAEPFGFSPEEIRQAEAEPRAMRILHLAMLGQQALNQRKNTEALTQGQQTRPAPTLKGGGGSATTNPARMGPAQMAKLLGYG